MLSGLQANHTILKTFGEKNTLSDLRCFLCNWDSVSKGEAQQQLLCILCFHCVDVGFVTGCPVRPLQSRQRYAHCSCANGREALGMY